MKLGIIGAVESTALLKALQTKHQLCWVVADPAQALLQQKKMPVDLLLVEIQPLFLTESIVLLRQSFHCPLVLFSTDGTDHTQLVFKAFGLGANDYIALNEQTTAELLLRKIQQQLLLLKPATTPKIRQVAADKQLTVVAIGASTGGPASLNELIKALPADFPAAIVIVQHLDGKFSSGMASWLGQEASMKVQLATAGELLKSGTVYLAAADQHLHLSAQGEFYYSDTPSPSLFKPSIDVFFESLVCNWSGTAIGILLTGMGFDGATGLKKMKDKGWFTIAQDQASSAVYGMPKAAVHLNAVTEVLPLDRIAERLIKLC
ncbi:chemotaxis response regulator protein-glutamate methylesterase [Rheinheimera riviphila]|uniref:protein-glutamate methylesterase n=1 Tax=Rheinheimera riviphila TaxID=1834037 RepID=A0A437R1F9_9GAMM|nr:chemotaxis protein CheB [Rheinheimera riviphila]RVU40575.1 chemotaxis response regulator protein-glutamate methylesterase [Rheinheimera riviphila]